MSGPTPASELSGIAIVGLACRLPGARDHAEFWRNLCEGKESIRFFDDAELLAAGVPKEALEHPDYVRAAPLLQDVDRFDAAFFGYSPREASLMDPQQRIFLETAWSAFEDAGYDPETTPDVVGVFAGGGGVVTSYMMAHSGYAAFPGQTGGIEHISNDKDFLSTRVSYKLNLTGPSLTVQTACSTSLVALHLACQSLESGECDMALAGASTVRLPHISGYMAARGSIYSSDGRCRAFDANGTGTIFGSGVAAVLLKNVSDAVADGDNIYAVIKSTAVNNDGGKKVSYTAPSVVGEARAMVEALSLADVPAETIRFVECHATGTTVGDPLEVQALTRAFRTRTSKAGFCALGSAKTNIGHAEQAAGMAGLIKAALSIHHGMIAPTRVETPNPAIPFEGSPFFLNQDLIPWPDDGDAPRRAAVNCLGIGGTNAFTVLEQAPESMPLGAGSRTRHVLCLSAKSPEALRERAGQFADVLAEAAPEDLVRICHTANVSRSRFSHRIAVAGDAETMRDKLATYAAGGAGHGITSERARPGKVAFLFSGQGFQHPGMARELYATQPTFRKALDRCDELFRPHLERGLLEVLHAEGELGEQLHQTGYTQPALFAVEYALSEMWAAWGIVPEAVMGHSIGEITAHCVAGAIDLEDAVELVAHRARGMQALPEGGGMLAVFADEETTRDLTAGIADLSVAAVNSPTNTVLSGPLAAIEEAVLALEGAEVASTRLKVSHAFHSALMEPMLEELEAVGTRIRMRAARVPVVSNVTGEVLEEATAASYWCDHARGAVQFADGVETLSGLGIDTFLEIGPGTGLLSLGKSSFRGSAHWIGSLDRKRGDWEVLLDAVRRLTLAGHTLDWNEVDAGLDQRRIPLPTYPFQRRRYWLDDQPGQRVAGMESAAPMEPESHERTIELDAARRRALAHHRIHGEVVFPTTLIVTEVLDEGRRVLEGDVEIDDLRYHRALLIPQPSEVDLKLAFSRQAEGLDFRLLARPHGGPWQEHAGGSVRRSSKGPLTLESPGTPRARCPRAIDPEALYPALAAAGLDYGPSLRGLEELHCSDEEAVFRVHAQGTDAGRPLAEQPFLLDACLHAYPVLSKDCLRADGSTPTEPDMYLPIGFERVRLFGHMPVDAVEVHARMRPQEPDEPLVLDLLVHDGEGRRVADLLGFALRRVPRTSLRRDGDQLRFRWLYDLAWAPSPRAEETPEIAPGAWLVLADDGGVARALSRRLEQAGHHCRLVYRTGHAPPPNGSPRAAEIDESDPAAFVALAGAFATEGRPIRGIVNAWPLDVPAFDTQAGDGLEAAEHLGPRAALFLLQAVTGIEALADAKLWCLTRSATPAGGASPDPSAGLLWGMGRTLALEHPRSWGGMIDLPAEGELTEHVAVELLAPDGEGEIAFRSDERFAARLAPWSPDPAVEARPLRTDGTVLVTGGLGMLGRKTARWLVEEQGIRHLVLTGRSSPREDRLLFVSELTALGAEVTCVQADVSREGDVRELFARIERDHPPLRGIVHCAGVLADGIAARMGWDDFARGLAPKLRGGWWLHHLSEGIELDLFVVHSSLLSWTGSVGQANYTAGNAFLDALIDHRRARGLAGMGVNWGPWAEAGMATLSGAKGREIWKRLGVQYIEPEAGLRAFAQLHDHQAAHGGFTITDWNRFVESQPASAHLAADLLAPAGDDGAGPLDALAARIREAQGDEVRGALVGALCAQAAIELGFDEPLAADQPLSELGLDSLISVNLANRIESTLGLSVPLVYLVQGPSVDDLVARLLSDPEFRIPEGRPARAPRPTAGTSTRTANAGGGAHANGASKTRAARSPGRWLVFPEPRPNAKMRLFCFPYAGAGAPVFQSWSALLDPSIELVAVEPPGRAGRIEEPPVSDMAAYMDGLMPDMRPYLDKPFALFGHCQGAMNLYETARVLADDASAELRHLFVSGARPPHHLFEIGRFEEQMVEGLLEFTSYDPALPLFDQPDEVFSEALLHFDIGATEQFLLNPELRALLLPAVRADFETLTAYEVEQGDPWPVPITCLVGLSDTYVSRRNALAWSEYTHAMFKVHYLDSSHYMVVEERDAILAVINHDLLAGRDALASAYARKHVQPRPNTRTADGTQTAP